MISNNFLISGFKNWLHYTLFVKNQEEFALYCAFVSKLYHNTLKFLPLKWLQKCSKFVGTSSDIFGNVRKSSENLRKCSEVAGTFREIAVIIRRKSYALSQKKLAGINSPDNNYNKQVEKIIRWKTLPWSHSAPARSSSFLRVFTSLLSNFIWPTRVDSYEKGEDILLSGEWMRITGGYVRELQTHYHCNTQAGTCTCGNSWWGRVARFCFASLLL